MEHNKREYAEWNDASHAKQLTPQPMEFPDCWRNQALVLIDMRGVSVFVSQLAEC
jgi:hypothetical protein